MVLKLSVTDQSPIHEGGRPSRGPHDSLRLAQACERFGYHRYWLAEHHNTPGYAGPCPEILIGHIAAHTRRIRVGSGGIMLPHYPPYKVAETFRMLEVLYPGRIDLGLGRAPGGDGQATAALAYPRQPINSDLYPRQVFDLMGYLNNDLPAQHPFHGIRLVPEDGGVPQFWMLGSSGGSAEVAGQLGSGFVLALFIGTHARSPAIIEAYRQAFQPSKSLQRSRH
ncbi:MsnO8 family LLM class oxidoreductase, partial [Immundisolibacter sp.]|uniref:MsnO8 family LLM class oxidoreductase n=1 Tax=Immundisolibacter sp. TaxID=1934948 RepID=UPI003562BBF1